MKVQRVYFDKTSINTSRHKRGCVILKQSLWNNLLHIVTRHHLKYVINSKETLLKGKFIKSQIKKKGHPYIQHIYSTNINNDKNEAKITPKKSK